jgi:hypothetical protein
MLSSLRVARWRKNTSQWLVLSFIFEKNGVCVKSAIMPVINRKH